MAITPFDFIKSASETKEDLIANSDDPETTEKDYNAYMVNRGFSFFPDTILHANEMNMNSHLPKYAQYLYYMSALRSRKRYSKWLKADKNEKLDAVQKYYQCNRNTAKSYLALLTDEDFIVINKGMDTGGKL